MTRARLIYLVIVAGNTIGGLVVLVLLQIATFPALGLAWTPIHAAQATGLLTVAACARSTCAWVIRRIRDRRSA